MEKKVCIITGACGDIGREIVRKFVNEDYRPVLIDMNEERLKDLELSLNIDQDHISRKTNVADEKEVKELVREIMDKYGRADVLVNAAGICGNYALTEDYDFDDLKRIYEVNVFGTFLMMKHILPLMKDKNAGSIVNIGSVSGMRGYKYEIGYGSSKWAVIGMSKNAAAEYGQYGIRVNCVSPGWVDTQMMKKTVNNYDDLVDDPERNVQLGPMNRAADAREIADVVYYLCTKEASFINGSNIVADGGKTAE